MFEMLTNEARRERSEGTDTGVQVLLLNIIKNSNETLLQRFWLLEGEGCCSTVSTGTTIYCFSGVCVTVCTLGYLIVARGRSLPATRW